MIHTNTKENVEKLQSFGMVLTPSTKSDEKRYDKKPVAVKDANGEWHHKKDWDIDSLISAKRVAVFHKESRVFAIDPDDKDYVAHKFMSCLPETFEVGKILDNGKVINTQRIYALPKDKHADKKYQYPHDVNDGSRVIETLVNTSSIIAGVDRVILNNVKPTVQDPSSMTLYARLIATFSELYKHWPEANKQLRDDAHLRLAGALAHTKIPLDLKEKFVERLCELTDDTEIKNRVGKLKRQEEAMLVNPEVVFNVKGLSDYLGINLPAFDEIKPKEIKKDKEVIGSEHIDHYPLVDGSMLLNREYPKPHFILEPIIRERTVSQFSGDYGSGKTHFGLSVFLAICHGRPFLDYTISKARPALYVEAELPGADIQERILSLNAPHIDVNDETKRYLYPENQYTLSQDDLILAGIKYGFKDIAVSADEDSAREGREVIENTVEQIRKKTGQYPVLFLDNISALTSIDENKAQDWSALMKWTVKMKNKGITVILFHHTGKTTGSASGSNMSQRLIDTHIILRKLKDDQRFEMAGKNVQCSVHFDKYRNFGGQSVLPYQLTCTEDGIWKKYPMLTQDDFKLITAVKEGQSKDEITKGKQKIMGQSTYYRRLKIIQESGLLPKTLKEEINEK